MWSITYRAKSSSSRAPSCSIMSWISLPRLVFEALCSSPLRTRSVSSKVEQWCYEKSSLPGDWGFLCCILFLGFMSGAGNNLQPGGFGSGSDSLGFVGRASAHAMTQLGARGFGRRGALSPCCQTGGMCSKGGALAAFTAIPRGSW